MHVHKRVSQEPALRRPGPEGAALPEPLTRKLSGAKKQSGEASV